MKITIIGINYPDIAVGGKNMVVQEQQETLRRVIAKAWSDPIFKARLIEEPKTLLTEEGIKIPEDISIEVVENTAAKSYLTLPKYPPSSIVSDEELGKLSSVLNNSNNLSYCCYTAGHFTCYEQKTCGIKCR